MRRQRDEAVAWPCVGVQTAIEIEIAHHRFLVVDGERRAAECARGNRVLPRPGQVARLPAPRRSASLACSSTDPLADASSRCDRAAAIFVSSRAISSRCASVGSASVEEQAREANLRGRWQAGDLAWAWQHPIAARALGGATLTVYDKEPVVSNFYLDGSLNTDTTARRWPRGPLDGANPE